MSLETLDGFFAWIAAYLGERDSEPVSLVWHGGEPLLLGVPFFRAALDLQRKRCGRHSGRITHSLQTNLTLINKDFIDVFKDMGMNTVGTSYDPVPGVRSLGASLDSTEYNERFFHGLRLLRENGLSWGVIYVVTKRSLEQPLKLFSFLSNLTLGKGFSFNPVLIYGDDPNGLAITPAEYVDFLGAILPTWWEHRALWPNIEPFAHYEKLIVRRQYTAGCSDTGRCWASHVYVGPGGELSRCGRAADWDIVGYGTIRDHSLREVFSEGGINTIFAERETALRGGDCGQCRFWDICHGGCPLDSFPAHGDLLHKSGWCDARRLFIERHFEPVTGVRYLGLRRAS
jgi:uncharacterized protein